MSKNNRQAILSLFLFILTYGTAPQKQALSALALAQPAPHAQKDTHSLTGKES